MSRANRTYGERKAWVTPVNYGTRADKPEEGFFRGKLRGGIELGLQRDLEAASGRGAFNTLLGASVGAAGVATASGGNHGAAVAYAARLRGVPAFVVMPEGVSRPKAAQVERLGARIGYCAPTLAAREAETVATKSARRKGSSAS